MSKQVVVIDYESNVGLRHFDQIDELEIPFELKQQIKNITKKNLNKEIANETPVKEYLMISGGCLIAIFFMFFGFGANNIFRLIGSISTITILIFLFLVMICSLRKNQNIITDYIDSIEQISNGCIMVELMYEDNVEYFPKKNIQKLQQNQVLVEMKFSFKNENLQKYLDNQIVNKVSKLEKNELTIDMYNN